MLKSINRAKVEKLRHRPLDFKDKGK